MRVISEIHKIGATMSEKDMIKSAKNGNTAKMAELLDSDPSLINARDSDGSSPLHCAAWKGHVEAVALLLQRGADVADENQNGHWGGTALHAAAHGNQRAVAEVLIKHGADVNKISFKGSTPLQDTFAHNATAVAKLLRANGATE
jgi:ankyrin repeat protein